MKHNEESTVYNRRRNDDIDLILLQFPQNYTKIMINVLGLHQQSVGSIK